jgi:dipeptidyl aminopeptidase/acylaminoacyl peptidase
MFIQKSSFTIGLVLLCALTAIAQGSPQTTPQAKPKMTIDEFFNAVEFTGLEMSPDGNSVVIVTDRADWDQQFFRDELWLYRMEGNGGTLIQLTHSGRESGPQWSPDGQWIAFLSERKQASGKSHSGADTKDEAIKQIYLISPKGGEAFPITEGKQEVHSFSWSADSHTIYFATAQPWTKTQKDDYEKKWKDVVEYRTAERGDTIFALDVAAALAPHTAGSPGATKSAEDEHEDTTPGAQAIAISPLRVDALVTSPDGRKLAFLSNAINQRQEKVEDSEIYTIDLSNLAQTPWSTKAEIPSQESQKPALAEPRRITHNQAAELQPRWAADNRHIFFRVEDGSVSGPYRDFQPHLYWVDTESGTTEQWNQDFIGPVEHYAVAGDHMFASARTGTEAQMYSAAKPAESLHPLGTWRGTYTRIAVADHSAHMAFIYSSLGKPEEVYVAESADKLDQARPITALNKLLTERDLPQGKPYQWKADDGTTVEGMLIYPPGKFEAKHLPMFTFIHGGPNDADGNHFIADWYQWAALAATNGWLVFEPNYRGSTGYGDKFLMQIVPQIVSRPGKDIVEGVDALVRDGIADPDHLTIGGYSYGGYLTNWLITQTARFKAAVTGAGTAEYVANWGNDDTTYDDAYFLGGRPWEAAQRYHDEAPIFQIDKVRTPTHMVTGDEDIRVAALESYLLEHALFSLGVPNKLLVLPGEGHEIDKNPWHGKIKVREELKWLAKYGGLPAGN